MSFDAIGNGFTTICQWTIHLRRALITLTYLADGSKVTKVTTGSAPATKNYVGGIEYTGTTVEAIYHAEGRCTPNGASFFYEYTIKDHLGNARVNFRANGTTSIHLESFQYYPFGMLMDNATSINDYILTQAKK